jgi:hypothetical protein
MVSPHDNSRPSLAKVLRGMKARCANKRLLAQVAGEVLGVGRGAKPPHQVPVDRSLYLAQEAVERPGAPGPSHPAQSHQRSGRVTSAFGRAHTVWTNRDGVREWTAGRATVTKGVHCGGPFT